MEYFNDERYWNIKLLNKWFAISSILFLASMVWIFIDDNDDDYKVYQKEFRKLSIENSEKSLEKELEFVEGERLKYEEEYNQKLVQFENKKDLFDSLESLLVDKKAVFYKANMEFLNQKAEIDVLKYQYEKETVHAHESDHNVNIYEEKFTKANLYSNELKLVKEAAEKDMLKVESEIKAMKEDLKLASDELNSYLKNVNLVDKRLQTLDRERMSLANKIADVIRDLPIIDFMDPYYKVKQIVVPDIKYDVNFAKVPTVDRCTSCHLGIDDPDFVDAPQPFTTHPKLDIFLSSSSPHPIQEYGCTGCHGGRSRGTTFVTSVHMPNDSNQKHEWEEEFDWKKMHHWLKPMLPSKYSEAGCFKCHIDKPHLDGGEKLSYGLSLIQKNGCNGCHLMQNYPQRRDAGPNLSKFNTKASKEWAMKWIKDPRSFRHNTAMPSFFGQDNNSDPKSVKRNETEIFTMVEYLFKEGEKLSNSNQNKYIGDKDSGEKLFNSVGCMGCHNVIETPEGLPEANTPMTLLSEQGPNLIGLGSKTTPEWIYKWIKNPQEYWPETKMPNLRLSDQEAKDITAYLLSFENKEFEEVDSWDVDIEELTDITLGWLKKMYPEVEAENKLKNMNYQDKLDYVADKSIRYYGCYGCHTIPGYEDAKPIGVELTTEGSKPVDKLDFGYIHDIEHTNYAWFEQKLENPRIFDRDKVVDPEDKLRMPNFYFSNEEIEAIVTAILSFNDDKVSDKVIAHQDLSDQEIEGHRIIKDLNCQGCHLIEDFGGKITESIGSQEFAPPNLNTQGEKVHPDWMFEFFKNPSIIRPPLQVRMPSFELTDEDWNAVISAFQSIDNQDLSFETIHGIDKNSISYKAGEKLAELGACNNCHFYGKTFPLQGAQTWAPNLAMSDERLREEWVIEWLRDPQKIMPGTKMPAPFLPTPDLLSTSDAKDIWGESLVKLNGNQDEMLKGITEYIFGIKGKSDISEEVKKYFKENGYEFNNQDEEEDWDDEDW